MNEVWGTMKNSNKILVMLCAGFLAYGRVSAARAEVTDTQFDFCSVLAQMVLDKRDCPDAGGESQWEALIARDVRLLIKNGKSIAKYAGFNPNDFKSCLQDAIDEAKAACDEEEDPPSDEAGQ